MVSGSIPLAILVTEGEFGALASSSLRSQVTFGGSNPLVVIKHLSYHFNLHLLTVTPVYFEWSGNFPWGYPTSLMCCPEHRQVGYMKMKTSKERLS